MKQYTRYLFLAILISTQFFAQFSFTDKIAAKRSSFTSAKLNAPQSLDSIKTSNNLCFSDLAWNSKNFANILGILYKFGKMEKLEFPGSEEYYEYNPILIDSGNTLIFSSFNNDAGRGGEDIFITTKINDQWQIPSGLSNLNTLLNEAPLYYSEKDKILFIYANYASSLGKGDIFKAEIKGIDFYEVESLPAPLNSRFFESDAFLVNDSVMIFSSDRPGCIGEYHPKGVKYNDSFWGNTDLFVCEKIKGKWSRVTNLGSTVNTKFAERTPFLSPDGNILFYSTNGRVNAKGLDVYYSFRQNLNSWTEWSEPQNFGKPVNSEGDEWGFKLSSENNSGYFTDDKDIYLIGFDEDFLNRPLIAVSGTVRNEQNEFLEAEINWGIFNEEDHFFSQKSSAKNGKFETFLPGGEHYFYSVSSDGYFPLQASLDLTAYQTSDEVNLEIVLLSKKFREGGSVSLIDKFLFDYNKYDIKEEAKPELSNIVYALKIMDKSENWKLNISGHTDSIGSREYNLVLSEKRAKAVYRFLISQGCDPTKFKISALGESQPVADNSSEEGRAQNRRVVLKIIEE